MSSAFVGIHQNYSHKKIVAGYLYHGPDEEGDIENPEVVFCESEEVIKSNLTVEEYLRLLILVGTQDILCKSRVYASIFLVRHDGNPWQLPPMGIRSDVARAKAVVRSQERWLELETIGQIPVYVSQKIYLGRLFQKHGVEPAKPPLNEKQLRN